MVDSRLFGFMNKEKQLHKQFYEALQTVLDLDAALLVLFDEISHAGGSPVEIQRRPEAVAGCKAVLDGYATTQKRIEHERERKLRSVEKRPQGKTFTLKKW